MGNQRGLFKMDGWTGMQARTCNLQLCAGQLDFEVHGARRSNEVL